MYFGIQTIISFLCCINKCSFEYIYLFLVSCTAPPAGYGYGAPPPGYGQPPGYAQPGPSMFGGDNPAYPPMANQYPPPKY